MSRGVNKVVLIGNVGTDPDIRSTSSGGQIAKFSLATNRSYKDAAGTKREETQWHRLTVFGKLVDVVDKYVKKGDRLYVEGRIEYSESEKDGQKRYWTDIIVSDLTMLGGDSQPNTSHTGQEPDEEEQPALKTCPKCGRPSTAPHRMLCKGPMVTEPDDDLPF